MSKNMAATESVTTPSGGIQSSTTKVVIVGAGFAGLSAAYHLAQQGAAFDVKVVEARDRIGGRVHTVDWAPSNDQNDVDISGNRIVELGGQWVHEASEKNPIRQLLKKFGIDFVPEMQTPESQTEWRSDQPVEGKVRRNVVFDSDGNEIGKAAFKTASRLFYKAIDDYDIKPGDSELDKKSFQDVLDEMIDLQSRSDGRLDRIRQESTGGFDQALNYLRHRTECYEGGKLSELSTTIDLYENLGGPDELPVGGYRRLIHALVESVGEERFRTSCPVDTITYDPSIIGDSKTENGSIVLNSKRQDIAPVTADFCICSIPLGVLQQRGIQFEPDLGKDYWKAVESIGMGNLEKVALQFESKFWGNIKTFGVGHQDASRVKTFFDAGTRSVRRRKDDESDDEQQDSVLYMFMGGAAAERLYEISDDEIVEDALETLGKVFGPETAIPKLSHSWVTRWKQDEYSRGAYSFAKVGVSQSDYERVGQPIGNLLFAGEHTSLNAHSTVHGAWQTGAREAARLIQWKKKRAANS